MKDTISNDYSSQSTLLNEQNDILNLLKYPIKGNHFLCQKCWTTPIIEFREQIIFRIVVAKIIKIKIKKKNYLL